MSKVRNLLRLYTEGVSKTAISERLSLPRNTVKKYIRLFLASNKSLEELNRMKDGELEQFFLDLAPRTSVENDNKYLVLREIFPEVEKALKKRGATKEALWKKYRKDNPDGYGLSQFKHYFRQWQKSNNPVMHIEHKAGEKMYVDYAGDKLKIVDDKTGEIIEVEVFVAVLGGSQLTYVEASRSQKTEDFIASCENALRYFGGSPLVIVTDNLKAAVIKSSRYEPVVNDAFRDFASHYTMAVLPAAPYKPTHKALVEGAVKIIYRSIYTVVHNGVFSCLETLNNTIREALEKLNNRPLSGRPYSRRQLFEETEAMTLQQLPVYPYGLRRRKVVTVMKNNYVYLREDKHYYSAPYHYIGKKVTLLYSDALVEIFHRYDCLAVHDRDRRPYKYSTIEDHLASKHRYVSDWNPEKFIQKASEIGEPCRDYIIGIISHKQHPEQAYRSCQGVLSFAARVGKDRLNNACRRAMQYGDYSYHTIRVILEKGYDHDLPAIDPNQPPIPPHDNIRGSGYFA